MENNEGDQPQENQEKIPNNNEENKETENILLKSELDNQEKQIKNESQEMHNKSNPIQSNDIDGKKQENLPKGDDEQNKEEDEKKDENSKIEDKKEATNEDNKINLEDNNINKGLKIEEPKKENNSENNENEKKEKPNDNNNDIKNQPKQSEIKEIINNYQNPNAYIENNFNNYNYVYNEENQTITPIITIKDLQNNPKEKLLINSPYSLKALYDSGYTLEELHYKTFDEFVDEHKEVLHINEEAKMNRFNFYEQLRLDKINNLVKYREKLIREEQTKENGKIEGTEKSMKNIIIDNHIRIAKEEIDILKKKHEKELANIIELELDKDLFNLEILKQEENYNKEYEKLNFLNLNNNGEDSENANEDVFGKQENKKNNRYKNNIMNNSMKNQNLRSSSSRRKNHIMLDERNTYLDNLYSLQQAKIDQKYEKNMKKNWKKLEKVEKVNKIKGEQMALKKRIEVERASQNLQKNSRDFQIKHENLIKEIQMKKLLIYQNKKKFEEYLKEKKEMNYLKYMEKLDYIQSLRRKDENLRQLKYEKLKDKQSQREKIKSDRMDVYDTKQLKIFYLDNERKRNIKKIKNILNNGVDEENLEKILQSFPGNREIDKVIENYKNKRDTIQNNEKINNNLFKRRPKSQGKILIKSINKKNINKPKEKNADLKIPNFLASNNNKNCDKNNTEDVKIYYESEIRDKVKQFKENVYKEFFNHVEDEKHNEDLRNKQLENIHDPRKRHELEKRFSKERALVDLRLKRENKNIQEKIRIYEINLRENNDNNHNLILKNK